MLVLGPASSDLHLPLVGRSDDAPLMRYRSLLERESAASGWGLSGGRCMRARFTPHRRGAGLQLKPDLDAVEALSTEREALWARV